MDSVQKAYAAFEVKSVDKARRTFSGWATTPATDRVGDNINPLGIKFRNPLVLLHQHKHDMPVGTVMFGKPTARGVPFEAEIPIVETDGLFKQRTDLAWDEIDYGVVRAVSIGFRPLKYSYKDSGGVDYQETEVYELSTVSIPALPEAVITSVKSMNGALSLNLVQEIRRFDPNRSAGGVSLVQVPKAQRPRGYVQLVTAEKRR